MSEWLATGESWGFEIGSDGVKEYRNGEEVPVDPLRAVELIAGFRFAVGDSIADLVEVPR